jgi:GrpB-like predicted nucleotidyltransferase (UPF0157 family)
VARRTSDLELSEPDAEWPEQFEAVRRDLVTTLGSAAMRIEHIGSTAVPGLFAKPTIDVLLVVADTDDVLDRLDSLASLGFEHRPEAWPDPERHVFLRRVVDGRRTHHLHVVPADSFEIADYLLLRDHLRAHPEEVEAYAAHKRRLATEVSGDRAGYVAAKPAYVEELLTRARRRTPQRPTARTDAR